MDPNPICIYGTDGDTKGRITVLLHATSTEALGHHKTYKKRFM